MSQQTPRQKMDANLEGRDDFGMDSSDYLNAVTMIGRGTKGCVVTYDRNGQRNFLDARLCCDPKSDFTLYTYHAIDFKTRSTVKKFKEVSYKWKLKDLKGLSLEEDASALIRTMYDEAESRNDEQAMESLKNTALGFSFMGCFNHISPTVVVGEGVERASELSFLLYDAENLNWWIDGLGYIAQQNDVDMNVAAVEEQMQSISLENENASAAEPTRRRMSKQHWTQEGLAEEEHQHTRKTLRRTRFTICPADDLPTSSTSVKKTRQSVFSGSSVSSAQLQQQSQELQTQFRQKELDYQAQIDKMDRDHSKEMQDLRARLDRAKNEVHQLKSEMETLQENNEVALTTQEEDFQLRQEQLEADYNTHIESVKAQYEEMCGQIQQLSSDNASVQEELGQVRAATQAQLEQVQSQHSAAMTNLLADITSFKHEAQSELETMKKMVTNLMSDKKKLINALIEAVGNIRVFVRIRPILPHEIEQSRAAGIKANDAKDLVCVNVMNQMDMFNAGEIGSKDKLAAVTNQKDDVQNLLNNSLGAFKVTVNSEGKSVPSEYEFENVFDQSSTQAQVAAQVLPFVTSVADGYSTIIFAYGQTSSGKTYTMEGTDSELGVNYTALTQLFNLLSERQAQMANTGVRHEFTVELSAVEVYNEDIKDLFSNTQVEMSFVNNKANVKNLSAHPVSSCDEIRSKLRNQAYPNRTVAATKMNAVSSRSHALLFINITNVYTVIDEPHRTETVTSRLVLVDLAGSERVSRSGVQGAGLTEANSINGSLTVLSRVLAGLQQGEKHIPYRESKLTMLLSDCLSGDSKVLMFANISPAGINATETNSTLQFAARAQKTSIGKATKNTSSLGTAASRPTLAAIGAGPAKKEDSIAQLTKIKTLEAEKQQLQQQLQQLQIQLQNKEKAYQQQSDMMAQDYQNLEVKLEKEKEKVKIANQNSMRLSTHIPSSAKCTPLKRPSQAKMSISTLPLCGSVDSMATDMVQLAPAPTIVMPSQLSTTISNLQDSQTQKKRKSTDMNVDLEDNQIAVHVNKQPRAALSSTTTPARPTISRTSPVASSAPAATSRPTISSTGAARPTISAAGSARPTVSSAAASKFAPAVGSTSRPTLSAAPSTALNRPTISAASRVGVPTGASTLAKKPATAALVPGTSARPTISAPGTVPRKTVSAVGTAAVRKPIGK